jgi:hypothetical protein
MQISDETMKLAIRLRSEVDASSTKSRRLKLKTLLALFGYAKRSDLNTSHITKILSEKGLTLSPPIVRFGDEWGSSMDDWVHVSDSSCMPAFSKQSKVALRAIQFESDKWFDKLAGMILRTEKEVEIKFIVPLLKRLGYDDDDRFDGMPVPAAHGSRDTTLVIDFALFDSSNEVLRHQPLLTVEAKKENRLKKKEELFRAHNQAKSYCLWTQCDYFMVTDSQHIQAFHIARGKLNQLDPIFACERHQLKERFIDLYALLSRDVLSKHYLAKFGVSEEIK